jgi:hypothetical protein
MELDDAELEEKHKVRSLIVRDNAIYDLAAYVTTF